MKGSVGRVALLVIVAVGILGLSLDEEAQNALPNGLAANEMTFQQDMDAYCTAKLNDSLSKLSAEDKKGEADRAFFSRKLHTCVQIYETLNPKDSGAMNYVVSDLTYGFVAPPKWHRTESDLHVHLSEIRNYHHLYVEGYWVPVSSDPGQQPVADANAVKLDCIYTEAKDAGDDSNSCTETQAYTQLGSINVDTQTYHIASWSRDEVIATDVERGLSGTTTTTLIIHPKANEVEVLDRTRMDEKQPSFTKGMEGKSFGDHYELQGGMYLLDTEGVFFQCDEDGVVIDMRLDIVEKHHGDVVNVPNAEWNAGAKTNHKFTAQECKVALQKELQRIQ
ncbi:hypothetical protein [Silvibacterium dinghuense]|uniref:Uncharacterized protein n=1 Tax=Silvibacterium dinghuense TaxID=1560006 RepID=A0A4Q1SIH7_9BACT|nr:hypothetical protein [Silvibacterium dinghuense]RXS97205.1 hypothetical protein ESZ00_04630 [Silvibacterium dinghuense]GGG97079.1 hypothetical protein GCM10011586_10410 [Silvibacterium dinghuense]